MTMVLLYIFAGAIISLGLWFVVDILIGFDGED